MSEKVIDIAGITIDVQTIDLEDSTDKACILTIKDEFKQVILTISYGRITDETIRSCKHE